MGRAGEGVELYPVDLRHTRCTATQANAGTLAMSDVVHALAYPLRPEPAQGESLRSYCQRFFSANGHEVPAHVLDALASMRSSEGVDDGLNKLRKMFGPGRVTRMLLSERGITVAVLKSLNKEWCRWALIPRRCGTCVNEALPHPLLNDLPLAQACLVHRNRLSEICLICGRRTSWSQLGRPWQCECGKSLATVERPAHPWELWITDTLRKMMPSAADLSQLYRAMDWACVVREQVKIDYASGDRLTPTRMAKISANPPGRWEAVLLMQSAPTLARRIGRLLRRLWRRDPRLLMCLNEGERFKALAKLLDEMPSMTAAGSPIRRAVTDALDKVRLDASGLHWVCFHPSLEPSLRASHLEVFHRWWQRLRRRLTTCDSGAELRRSSTPQLEEGSAVLQGQRLVASILNRLWTAALAKLPPSRFTALQSRWQPPLLLVLEADTMAALGAALILLPDEELSYVGALIDRDISRV